MKKIKYNILFLLGIISMAMGALTSCNDEPDSEHLYSFSGEMMSQYLQSNAQFSEFSSIVSKAGLMDQLSAWGHYTLFLPNNDAVQAYYQKRGISSINDLTKEDCDTIARTHIISEKIFSTTDMPDNTLSSQNMLNRNIDISHDVDEESNPIIIINGKSRIYYKHQNDSVENGIIHEIDVVLENSSKSVGSLMQDNESVSLWASALHATKLDEVMDSTEDLEYRERWKNNEYTKHMSLKTGSRNADDVYAPEHKYYGFTAFVVKNSVLRQKYKVDNLKDLYDLAAKLYAPVFPEDVDKEEWKYDHLSSDINPLKRFLMYHILDRNLNGQLTVREDAGVAIDVVNPTEWYTTMLPYSMIKLEKITATPLAYMANIGDYYINRRCTRDSKYSEQGVRIDLNMESENVNNSANGYYYYIDDILVWSDYVRSVVQTDRIRMDFSTIFPEIATNNMRMNGTSIKDDNVGKNYWFPRGYLKGVVLQGDSRLTYWYAKPGYYSMHGDEMDAQDVFDITFNLPPFPTTTEWQIRLGFAPMDKLHDGAERGQVQIYIDGVAQGIPLNMEERLSDASIYGVTTFPTYTSIRDDDDKRQADFKILKNKGYYRGPHSVFTSSDGKTHNAGSEFSGKVNTVRKVLCTKRMEANMTHTIRIKNVSTVLPKMKEAMLDYLELVPKSVYGVADGDSQEDDL